MRVCLHTFWDIAHDFIGGTERFIIELCKELRVLGIDAFIVCTGDNTRTNIQGVDVYGVIDPGYKNELYEVGEAKAALLKKLFVDGKHVKQSISELSRYVELQVEQFEFDLVHLNSFPSSMFFRTDKPVIVTNHENREESEALWGAGIFDEIRALSKSTDTTFLSHYARVVPSRHYAQEYSSFFKAEILAVNQGVNISCFRNLHGQDQVNRNGQVRILLPSRLEPQQKGHDLAIEACKLLVDQGVDVTMIFSGLRNDNRETVKILREYADRLGVASRIIFKSYSDMLHAYQDVDIVISPERFCSYGLSISESLAVGKPTVLSDIPTYREIASGFSHAYFFEPENVVQLSQRIIDAVSNETSMSDFDTVKFRSRYDFRECAKQYTELYISAIKNH